MEYIQGETLDDRIRRGRVPVVDAVVAMTQVVDALDRAHRRGIVHRDLKPGNIMWTKSGVKLLDFGLAARRSRGAAAGDDLTAVKSRMLTAEGAIVGTLQYMAPEQLQGLAVDARTDIFAFGAVAYEMLTGMHAFEGKSQAALIGAILRDEPTQMAELAPEIPVPLARTLSRCLAKEPDERWQTASDLLFQLRSLTTWSGAVAAGPPTPKRSPWIERSAWIGLIAATVVAGVVWFSRSGPSLADEAKPFPPVVFSVTPARGASLADFSTPFAASPDGRTLAYVAAGGDGVRQLWLRSLDSGGERLLPGTEGANTPFWSPDSQWIGFFAANGLNKARASTGVTQTIASDVATSGGASWGARDDIVFPGLRLGMSRVSANGGPVSRLAVEFGHLHSPQFLTDGRHFIYSATSRSAIEVASLDGGQPRTVMALNVGTSPVGFGRGHVFFVQDNVLFARPFDERRLEFTSDARRIVTGVPAGIPARSPFSVSASGVLAYWTSPLGAPAVLSWFERDGRSSAAVSGPARYRGFALSPDSERLAFARIARLGGVDLWVRSLRDNTEMQMTSNGAAFLPLWSPDGLRLAFSGFAFSPSPKVRVKSVRDNREETLIGDSPRATFATSWTPGGRAIVFVRNADLPSHSDVWLQRVAGGPAERLWFNTQSNEMQGKVSPDGRSIAYTTDESGSAEVWVAGYPSGTVKRPVSTVGGDFPQWAGDELFFVSPDRQLMAARVTAGDGGPRVEAARALFRIPTLASSDPALIASSSPFVVTADGRRFLIAERAHDPDAPPITVVVNWPALLKR